MDTIRATCTVDFVLGQAMTDVFRPITVVFLALFALFARAAGDWIDALPTVTAVAHAVREQLNADAANWRFDVRRVALEDDDLFAVAREDLGPDIATAPAAERVYDVMQRTASIR